MNFSGYAAWREREIRVPSVGEQYAVGSSVLEILSVGAEGSINDTSIVLKITYGKTVFLFTGDASAEVLCNIPDLRADVLKVSHHGSTSGTSRELLEAVNADYAVISVGRGNDYGHPTGAALELLENSGLQVFRTDLQGDIVVTSDGRNLTFQPEKDISPSALTVPGTPAEPKAGEEPRSPCTYIVNLNSSVFHLPDCRSASQMKEDNKWYFSGTRDELISLGCKPCGSCRP